MSQTQDSGDMPRLIETSKDPWGTDYVTVWRCDPPSPSVGFRVIRSEWNEDFTVRTILEIELA